MSTTSLTALVTAITGLVAAVATLIGVIRHVTGPAHKAQAQPPSKENPAARADVSPLPDPPMQDLPGPTQTAPPA